MFAALESAADGAGRGGQRRRRHRDDLPRLQGRDRHGRRACAGDHIVGVLVQANHGRAARGCASTASRSGRELGPERVPLPPSLAPGRLDHRRRRDRRAAAAAPVRRGSRSARRSGSRARAAPARTRAATSCSRSRPATAISSSDARAARRCSPNERLDPLFYAAIEATEEAIVNALLAAETMTGRGGATVHAIDHEALEEIVERHR